jgi:hypothetical protein
MAGYAFGSAPALWRFHRRPGLEPGPFTRGVHWTQKCKASCRIVRTRRMGSGSEAGATVLWCLAEPTKQPAGQISKNLSSPSRKNISLNLSGKSLLPIRPSHPRQGRFANVTNARWDAMDATASARAGIAGRLAVSDRTARGRTTLPTVLAGARRAARVRGRIFGRGGRGRRSRVVLAPRCWRQVLRRRIRPNRVFGCIKFRKATVSKSPVTGESSK